MSIPTSAESDIQQLTQITTRWSGAGASSEAIGPITVLPSESQGPFLPGASETSQEPQRLVDAEVRKLVDDRPSRGHAAAGGASRTARGPRSGTTQGGDAGRARRLRRRRRAADGARIGSRWSPRRSICTPAVQTARLTSAEATIAVATTGGEQMLGQPQRGDRRRHAELRAGRQRSAQRLAHEQRREQVDHDVQHRERACQRESSAGWSTSPAERSSWAPGADEVERHEEAVGDAAHLR